jgi:NH3-dependent NAD+ synthetase
MLSVVASYDTTTRHSIRQMQNLMLLVSVKVGGTTICECCRKYLAGFGDRASIETLISFANTRQRLQRAVPRRAE